MGWGVRICLARLLLTRLACVHWTVHFVYMQYKDLSPTSITGRKRTIEIITSQHWSLNLTSDLWCLCSPPKHRLSWSWWEQCNYTAAPVARYTAPGCVLCFHCVLAWADAAQCWTVCGPYSPVYISERFHRLPVNTAWGRYAVNEHNSATVRHRKNDFNRGLLLGSSQSVWDSVYLRVLCNLLFPLLLLLLRQ